MCCPRSGADVYQGAPTPVTAFLAVGSKAAGFALLLRVLLAGLLPVQYIWGPLLLVLAGATLFYGNLGAIPQHNIKRLLGYSSIGHAGYMLMGIAAGNALGVSAVLFYLGQYAFTNLCAFLAIIATTAVTGSDEISSFSGLGKRSPILGVALFLSMMSLAGVPPMTGFFGKFQLFAAVIQRAQTDSHYYILAVIGAVAVVILHCTFTSASGARFSVTAEDMSANPCKYADAVGALCLHGGHDRLGDLPAPAGQCLDNGCKGLWLTLESAYATAGQSDQRRISLRAGTAETARLLRKSV